MGLLVFKKAKSQNWDLLYYGLGTSAAVKQYENTGTLVNNNPVVKFTYTYPDQRGQIIEGSDKKVLGKLEIAGLPDMHELEIMYMPNSAHISRLADGLTKTGVFYLCEPYASLLSVHFFCNPFGFFLPRYILIALLVIPGNTI